MIKYVVQVIPTYTMSTFEVPLSICDKIDSATRRFWWNSSSLRERYLAWKAGDNLCMPKNVGGLGFRKTKDFNMALMAKLSWMIGSKKEFLCIKFLRSKYKVSEHWLRQQPTKGASPVWKAIEKAKSLIS